MNSDTRDMNNKNTLARTYNLYMILTHTYRGTCANQNTRSKTAEAAWETLLVNFKRTVCQTCMKSKQSVKLGYSKHSLVTFYIKCLISSEPVVHL
jgi:hypothetical protein